MQQRKGTPGGPEEFIERFAHRFGDRMPRAAARMLGALMITEEGDLSSKQLVELLGLSPAAVSNSGRLLLGMALVERRVSPETRRDHYWVRDDVWVRMYQEDETVVHETLSLLDETLEHDVTPDGRAAARLREMRDFYAFLCREMPEIVARYEKWRAG